MKDTEDSAVDICEGTGRVGVGWRTGKNRKLRNVQSQVRATTRGLTEVSSETNEDGCTAKETAPSEWWLAEDRHPSFWGAIPQMVCSGGRGGGSDIPSGDGGGHAVGEEDYQGLGVLWVPLCTGSKLGIRGT